MEMAHQWQVKYYIYVLEYNGIEGVTGILEYPALRQKSQVILTDDDRAKIHKIKEEIDVLTSSDNCPQRIERKFCKSCSYYEFCYIGENEA
jgi:CRISPR-associated exonuclease Cas4